MKKIDILTVLYSMNTACISICLDIFDYLYHFIISAHKSCEYFVKFMLVFLDIVNRIIFSFLLTTCLLLESGIILGFYILTFSPVTLMDSLNSYRSFIYLFA